MLNYKRDDNSYKDFQVINISHKDHSGQDSKLNAESSDQLSKTAERPQAMFVGVSTRFIGSLLI